MFTEVHCVITGRVQRVGYRDFVINAARTCSIYGWVRNNNDGSVEIVGQGIPDDLKRFIESLQNGSPLAKVESVAVNWRSPEKNFDDFEVWF